MLEMKLHCSSSSLVHFTSRNPRELPDDGHVASYLQGQSLLHKNPIRGDRRGRGSDARARGVRGRSPESVYVMTLMTLDTCAVLHYSN